jgi:ADP-heptose:LPS heptosyltransferase
LLAACDAFVGLDSTLAHAASAFAKPSVVVFAPGVSSIWGSKSNINVYIKKTPEVSVPSSDQNRSCETPDYSIPLELVNKALRSQLEGTPKLSCS